MALWKARSNFLFLVLMVMIALVGTACASDGGEEAAPPDDAGEATPDTDAGETEAPTEETLEPETSDIRLMPAAIPQFLPIFVAQEEGFFEDYGLNAEILEFEGGAGRSTEAAVSGEVEFGYTSWPLAFSLAERGQQLKFTTHHAFYARHEGVDYGQHDLVVLEDSPIQGIEDLEGARIAVVARGSNEEAFLAHLLQEVGLSLDDVELIEAFWGDQPSLLESGDIDVGYMIYPFTGAVIPYGETSGNGYRTLGDPYLGGEGDIPETLGDTGAALFPMAVRQEFFDNNPNTIRAFALAVRDAMVWISENPEEALEISVEATGIPAEAQQNNPPQLYVTWHPELMGQMEFVAQTMVDAGILEDMPDLESFVSNLPYTEEEMTEEGQFFSWNPADL